MDTGAALSVTLLLNIQRRRGDTSSADQLVRRFADRFWSTDWPGSSRPGVFYDPRALELEGPTGVLHAKAVVDDDEVVLEIEGFAVRLADLFDRQQQLDDWATETVRRNCVATGLDGRTEIPLAEYLDVVRRARLPRSDAFRAMLNWWSAQPARS